MLRPRPIEWYATTELNLSLHDFYNAGLTVEEMVTEIRGLADPGSLTLNLRCDDDDPYHVRTSATTPEVLEDLVSEIGTRLRGLLATRRAAVTP